MIADIVRHYLRAADEERTMHRLRQICEHDRYQASLGIGAAAELVACFAEEAGLSHVAIDWHSADGQRRWWSFAAPLAWTPVKACVTIRTGDSLHVIDHSKAPFTLATYSAETPLGGVSGPMVRFADIGERVIDGAVCLLPSSDWSTTTLECLRQKGFAGFISDRGARKTPTGVGAPGRIELPGETRLFGFSVSEEVFQRLDADCRIYGAIAQTEIVVDRNAAMPVVSGTLQGVREDGEIWLTSHLCHPRPGANDNASGVSALIEIAELLSEARRYRRDFGADRTIRFLFGPEFTGTVAFLHDWFTRRGRNDWPLAVLNFDMVGENQTLCGGPFVVERSPVTHQSLLDPLVEAVVGTVFKETYEPYYSWRKVPFMGMSDHAVFARKGQGAPTVQFCHTIDRFNHSAADSIDKVSSLEMARAAVSGAACAQILAADRAELTSAVGQIVECWCQQDTKEIAIREDSSQNMAEARRWREDLLRHAADRHQVMRSLVQRAEFSANPSISPFCAQAPRTYSNKAAALVPCYEGPPNVRALVADLPTQFRAMFEGLAQADKSVLSLILRFLIQVDGQTNRREIIHSTELDEGRPIEPGLASKLVQMLTASGWVTEG